jgi:tRNA threonylcarbamoyl adenosine modification protein (Sua5/YciO/YrdC/YwlC family)
VQLLIGDASWLDRVARDFDDARALARAFWPGPLTLVVPASQDAPATLSADGTIGVRVPDHPLALEVLERTGPLAASSANRSGSPTPSTLAEIAGVFGDEVGALLDGGEIAGTGSTVLDLTGGEPRLLRRGPVSWADVTDVLHRSS